MINEDDNDGTDTQWS